MKTSIFISSVQKELAAERRALKDYIEGDPLLRRFFKVFLFEDIPAGDRKPSDIYLAEVERCDIYVAILGNQYGWANADGKSATELEFDHATKTHRERLVFVKGDDKAREPDMARFVTKAGRQVTRRRFADESGLISEVYASLVESLENRGLLQTGPFDDSACAGATLKDIDEEQVTAFVETAEAKGRLTLKGSRAPHAVLQNFNLLKGDKPTNAAILLFGREPRHFFHNAQVHCFHFLGVEKRKPIASQQPYEGRLFAVIDEAVEFVLGKLDRPVGTRAKSAKADGNFEIPRSVIAEAVVNAVAHRNYRNNGFVQVIVFADRVEVWNPGELPPGLTSELLRKPHGPIPRNPLIAEPLFRVKYVEKAGTGTTDMIADCRRAGLPEPDFRQCGPFFVATLWRDSLTDEVMDRLGLNERQRKAVLHVKTAGRISNQEYQAVASTTKKTASRDLDDLVLKGVLDRIGETGRGAFYLLKSKGDINGTNETLRGRSAKGAHGTTKTALKSKVLQASRLRHGTATRQRQRRERMWKDVATVTPQVGTKSGPSRDQVVLLRKCQTESAIADLMALAGRSNRTKFRDQVLKPLLDGGFIEMTIPDKPTSRLQKYRLTDKGRDWLTAGKS
jgi:predicted HTH transcriptional regulator